MAMRTLRLALALAIAAFAAIALLPSSAAADDASVFAAYNGHQEEFAQAAANYRRAVRNARRSSRGATDDQLRAIIDADKQINAVLVTITGEVKAQQPSGPPGARAKKYALRNLILFKKANDLEILSYEHLLDGKKRASDAAYRRGIQTLKRSSRYGKLAVKAFDKLGLRN